MIALILAAGLGSRLNGLSKNIPKPMIAYKNKPLLEHNVIKCVKAGITEIYINVHYQKKVIKDYFGDGKKWNCKIFYSEEDILLGTSGALKKVSLNNLSQNFIVVYGDNYSSYNFNEIINFHNDNKCNMTIVAAEIKNPSESGILDFDSSFKLVNFTEKPANTDKFSSYYANMGIYVIEKEILQYIPLGCSDFGKNIIPELLKKNVPIAVKLMKKNVVGIDTPLLFNKYLKDVPNDLL